MQVKVISYCTNKLAHTRKLCQLTITGKQEQAKQNTTEQNHYNMCICQNYKISIIYAIEQHSAKYIFCFMEESKSGVERHEGEQNLNFYFWVNFSRAIK